MTEKHKKIILACANDWTKRSDVAIAYGVKKVHPDFIRLLESLVTAQKILKDEDVLPNGVRRFWYRATDEALQDALEGQEAPKDDVQHELF
jgi:hypothetical protein